MDRDTQAEPVLLADQGVLAARGVDADRFLQGQLSQDIARLVPGALLLAGYHNTQGRVLALLRLVRADAQGILAVMPRELVGPTAERLRRYVLRSKVTIGDESHQWRISGIGRHARQGYEARPHDILVPYDERGGRHLLLRDVTAASPVADPAALAAWHALDVRAGLPQIYAATVEQFVAQMLNLDVLGGISFEKGCYTGQEVIARAHYRGRVKRRMQRFGLAAQFADAHGHGITAGATVDVVDGRRAQVVDAARREDGSLEFLAVTGEAPDPALAMPAAVPAVCLPLPYALPWSHEQAPARGGTD